MSRRFRATTWRYRWLIVACCMAVAAWLMLSELRPPDPQTTVAVVATHDLPAGTVVTDGDVREVPLPSVPGRAVSVDDAVGATLTISVTAGLPLIDSMFLGPGLVDAAPDGSVVAPISLADANVVAILRVGDRVDLYATGTAAGTASESTLVTGDALVLATAIASGGQSPWWGAPTQSGGGVIVVAIPAHDAAALTLAGARGPFQAVVSPP